MGLFTPPEDLLISAMSSKQPQIRLEHCIGSIDGVFKNALKKERRLLAFLSSYEANFVKKGLVQISYDYDVTIQYQESCPTSLNDVVVDNGDWDATTILKKGIPQEVTLITNDIPGVSKKLTDILDVMLSSYECSGPVKTTILGPAKTTNFSPTKTTNPRKKRSQPSLGM